MPDTETLPETDELEGLEDHFHNLPDVESPSIAANEREVDSSSHEKESPGTPDTKEHQPEPLTTRELVLQELVKSGRGEGFEVKEPQGTLRFSEDGKELFDEKDVSLTKLIEERGNEEEIAMHYEMLQQFRDGGDAIFINKEQPGDEDPDTMHGSYMMRNEDGSISWGLTERKIERGEEEGSTGREEEGAPAEDRWTTSEHTEHEVLQFDGSPEVSAQLGAAQKANISQPDTVGLGSGEEKDEQVTIIDIETTASPAVDSVETITHETIEVGNAPVEVAHDLSGVEVDLISEFLHADSLESLPVFQIPETAHVPEAVVPDTASSQAPQSLDIRETSMYQAIVAFLKNDTDAISVSEKPDEEVIVERVAEAAESHPVSEFREEAREDVVITPIENSTDGTAPEVQSQATASVEATVRIETTTSQVTPIEAPVVAFRAEEKADVPTMLRNTDNTIRRAPEVVQAGNDRKIDEMESFGVRPEASERQPVLNAHEILLKTLGIREKTVAIREERPYNNTQRVGGRIIQLPSRISTQSRGRTSSKFGISLIEV